MTDQPKASLLLYKKHGIYLIAYQNSTGIKSNSNKCIKSWMHQDEPDNAQPITQGWGPCVAPGALAELYKTWKSNDATRPIFLNFGQGVSFIGWYGRGDLRNIGGRDYSSAGGHYPDYYAAASEYADIIAFDIYPVTSKDAEVKGKLEYVSNGVKNLIKWTGGKKIVWNCIETTHIDNPNTRPNAEQIKSEVWMSIISGSMGIIYFCHEFAPAFREDGFFKYPEIVEAIGKLNAGIYSLAPVLNSPVVLNKVKVTSDNAKVPIDFMVKEHSENTYIFAAAMRNVDVTGTFTVGRVNGAGRVEVVDENRQISMSSGSFRDNFKGYGVHIYRIKNK